MADGAGPAPWYANAAPSSSSSKAAVSQSLADKKPKVSRTVAALDEEDGDDETDFFNRRKKKAPAPAPTSSGGGDDGADFFNVRPRRAAAPLVIDEEDIRRAVEKAEAEGPPPSDHESSASSVSYDSDGNERRRRKRKRKFNGRQQDGLSHWMRNGLGEESAEEEKAQLSEDSSVIHLSDSDGDNKKGIKRKRKAASPELTPPPELSELTRNKTRSIVQAQFKLLAPKSSPESLALPKYRVHQNTAPDVLILDPDLASMYRGSDAKEVRARALAAEAARRNARETVAKMEKERQELVNSPSRKGKKKGGSDDEDDAELVDLANDSDNDSVTWQPDIMPTTTAKPKWTQQPTQPGASAAHAYEVGNDSDSDDDPVPTAEAPAPTAAAAGAAAADDDDGEERIEIKLKGPNGVEMDAKVKPTTVLQRVLDHFKRTKNAEIPADKRNSIKLRFDGENLPLAKSVEDAEIEDGDLIEVAW